MAGGPAVGVAGLEEVTSGGARLLDGGLDGVADDMGDAEAEGEEEGVDLAAEEEVGDEAAQGDEDRNEGDPRKEVSDRITTLVADVGECHSLQRRWRRRKGHGDDLRLVGSSQVVGRRKL